MKKGFWFRSIRVVIVLVVSVLMAVLLVVFRPQAERQERVANGRLVTTFQAKPETVHMTVEAFGTVSPKETLKLVAQVPGRIVTMAPEFVAGGFASAETVLLTIDPRSYELAVKHRRVQIAQAEAELAQLDQEVENLGASIDLARSNTALAWADFDRLQTLAKRNVVAQTSLDQAEQRYLASQERLQELKNRLATTGPTRRQIQAGLAMARVSLSQAELDLEHTQVAAPFDGWVIEKRVERGQHVAQGQLLGSIYRAGALEVEVRIAGGDLRWLWADEGANRPVPAEVQFEGDGLDRLWTGRIERVNAGFDAATRTLPVVVAIDTTTDGTDPGQPPLALRPGMFVTVRLLGDPRSGIFVLPRHAMRPDDTVYVADAGHLRVRPVTVLRRYEDKVFVSSGLIAGDRIIDTPLTGAVDGMKIRVKP